MGGEKTRMVPFLYLKKKVFYGVAYIRAKIYMQPCMGKGFTTVDCGC
jgi:hypothetical protein